MSLSSLLTLLIETVVFLMTMYKAYKATRSAAAMPRILQVFFRGMRRVFIKSDSDAFSRWSHTLSYHALGSSILHCHRKSAQRSKGHFTNVHTVPYTPNCILAIGRIVRLLPSRSRRLLTTTPPACSGPLFPH